MNINIKTLSKISLIINKMGVSEKLKGLNLEGTSEELGKELIATILENMYKAEEEIIDLIAMTKGITKEEAENINMIEYLQEMFGNDKLKSFFN